MNDVASLRLGKCPGMSRRKRRIKTMASTNARTATFSSLNPKAFGQLGKGKNGSVLRSLSFELRLAETAKAVGGADLTDPDQFRICREAMTSRA